MSNLTSIINVNVDAKDKEKANKILNNLGINMSTAINMFIKQIINKDGIPFEVKNPIPNNELIKAIQEGENILNGKIESKGYHNVKKMFDDILNED